MATTLQHKRSGTAGSVPGTSDLALGEIAINSNDGYLFIKKDDGTQSIVTFKPGVSTAADQVITVDTYTGDDSTTTFTLTKIPSTDQHVFATINGVLQQIDAYYYVGRELTFSTAPANGDIIELRVIDVRATDVVLRDHVSYFYSIGDTTSSISNSTLDDNGLQLAYDVGKLDVYQNGVKLIGGSDFTATTGTSILFTTSLEVGDIIEVVSYGSVALVDADALKPSGQVLSTTTPDQVVDLIDSSAYRTVKYIVQATAGTDYHATEILSIHDGTSVYMTEYATIFSNSSLATFDSDIVNGKLRLLCTPANQDTTIKIQRITVGV